MKILHICDHYRPIGGAERLLFDTLEALENNSDIENVIAMHDYAENRITGRRKEYIINDLDIQPYSWNLLDYLRRGIRSKKSLRHVIEVEKPDVIHIHNLQNPFIINEAVRVIPTVRSIHDPRLYCFNNWRILRKDNKICPYPLGFRCITEGCLWSELLRLSFEGRCAIPKYFSYLFHRKVDKLIVESEAMKACVLQNGYNKEQIALLPNFTKTFNFDEVMQRNEKYDNPEENSILFVGRASFEKGIDYLLEAVATINIPFKLYLVTGGPAISEVYSKIEQLNLSSKVEVLGILSYGKTRDCYAMADVVVIPSVWIESFCLVGVEAMANAKPVVAFQTGGIYDWLVDGKTGYLAECRNIEDLANKIKMILKDKAKAKEMGICGYHRVQEKYNINTYLPGIMNIYNNAIQYRKQRRSTKSWQGYFFSLPHW